MIASKCFWLVSVSVECRELNLLSSLSNVQQPYTDSATSLSDSSFVLLKQPILLISKLEVLHMCTIIHWCLSHVTSFCALFDLQQINIYYIWSWYYLFTFYLVDFIWVLGSSRGQQIYTNGRARFVCSFKSYKVLKVIWNKEDNDTFPEKSRVKVLTTPIFWKKSRSIIVSLSLLHVISFWLLIFTFRPTACCI